MYHNKIEDILPGVFNSIHESVITCSEKHSFTDPLHAINFVSSKPDIYMGALMLNSKHKLLADVKLYKSVPGCEKQVIKKTAIKALKMNAAAIIFYDHNYKRTGKNEILIKALVNALNHFDIKVLDFITPTKLGGYYSFASRHMI